MSEMSALIICRVYLFRSYKFKWEARWPPNLESAVRKCYWAQNSLHLKLGNTSSKPFFKHLRIALSNFAVQVAQKDFFIFISRSNVALSLGYIFITLYDKPKCGF